MRLPCHSGATHKLVGGRVLPALLCFCRTEPEDQRETAREPHLRSWAPPPDPRGAVQAGHRALRALGTGSVGGRCALSPSERVEARVCASSGQRVGSQLGSRGWEEMPRGAGPQPGARGDPAGAAHAHVLLCEQMAAIERNASSPGLHRNLTEY